MEKDIAPELLKKIQTEFQKKLGKSSVAKKVADMIEAGTATYSDAHDYAVEVGEILASVFGENLSSDILPDGRLYYNIAQRILEPTLKQNYNLVTSFTSQIQEILNKKAGIGLKAIKPELNEDKIIGLINKTSTAASYDDVAWALDAPVVNFTQSVVDDSVRSNAEFQYNAGLNSKIVRTSTGKCCDWCKRLVGIYDYGEMYSKGNDVFRRHDNCKCKVEHLIGGRSHVVHTGTEGHRKYAKDQYGEYVLSKDERVRRDAELKRTEKERKEAARQKRINTWKEKNTDQYYKPIIKGEKTIYIDRKMGKIILDKVEGYKDVYTEETVKIKRRALHTINSNVEEAINLYGGDISKRPKLVIVDKERLGALGKYDCVQNILYIAPEAGDRKALGRFTVIDDAVKLKTTEYHECWHWMQVQKYGKEITEQTRSSKYMPWLLEQCKNNIDTLGITRYNVDKISVYAHAMYFKGRYDEVEAEFYTILMLKRKR